MLAMFLHCFGERLYPSLVFCCSASKEQGIGTRECRKWLAKFSAWENPAITIGCCGVKKHNVEITLDREVLKAIIK